MSGSRRKSQYRKNVTSEFLTSFPEPAEGEFIAKIVNTRGGNIFSAILSDGREEGIYMPKKFKNLLWIRRGDYVIVTGGGDEKEEEVKDAELQTTGGIKFEITHIINKQQHIQYLLDKQLWPQIFPLENVKDKGREYNGKEELMPGYDSQEECDETEAPTSSNLNTNSPNPAEKQGGGVVGGGVGEGKKQIIESNSTGTGTDTDTTNKNAVIVLSLKVQIRELLSKLKSGSLDERETEEVEDMVLDLSEQLEAMSIVTSVAVVKPEPNTDTTTVFDSVNTNRNSSDSSNSNSSNSSSSSSNSSSNNNI